MKGLALALVVLMLVAPAPPSDDEGGLGLDKDSCDFFSWTLSPPDYRIDEDCPPLGSLGP